MFTKLTLVVCINISLCTLFHGSMDEYRHRGVHHAFRGHPDAPDILSRDLEPEYIALNTAQTSAYVTLQVSIKPGRHEI